MGFDDVRFSVRLLRRDRVYAAATVVTLALAIGAATAVYAVIDATLLRPLPYRSPERLVAIGVFAKAPDGAESPFGPSQIELVRWATATRTFEARAGIEPRIVALTGNGEAQAMKAAAVSSDLFGMLGVDPIRGRAFSADEEQSDAPVALVSEALWRRRLHAADALAGVVVEIDGRPYDVVGVMPAGFAPTGVASDLWLPLHATEDPAKAGTRVMNGLGRLRPGVNPGQAEQELAPISEVLAREHPNGYQVRPRVTPLRDQLYGSQTPALLALSGAVALLLALASVNVMNLTLGHLARRRDEIGVRAMIGGSAWRLARLQIVETGLLTVAGGALGLWIVGDLLPPLLRIYAAAGQTPIDARVDWRVTSFAFGVTAATALVCAIVPALRAHHDAVSGRTSPAVRSTMTPRERKTRGALMTLQVGLAITLLCAAAAFGVSLRRVLASNPGFAADHVLAAQIMLAPARYTDVRSRARFVDRVVERIAALPGVVAVGTSQTTFLPNQSMQTSVYVEGEPLDPEHAATANMRHVMPGYFAALHVPIVEGRAIEARDRAGAPMVAVVSAAFARTRWPGTSPIGHRIRRTGATAQWLTVVGIAADVMDVGLGVAPGPTLYVPYQQQNTITARVTLLVRGEVDPQSLASQVQRAVWTEDPLQPIDAIAPLEDLLAGSAGDRRFQTLILSAFALVALMLALVGVYGVAASAVKARAREVGIRLALGAAPRTIVADAMAETGVRILIGVVAGLAVFLAAGRPLARLLYGTAATDPLILGAAVLPLMAAAIAIGYRQARRLAATPAVVALRGID